MVVKRGTTQYFSYDNESEEITLNETKLTYKEAKTLIRSLTQTVQESQTVKPPVSSPAISTLATPPWIFRKLFGWQNVIKKA